MADKRMFTKKITESDAFLDMPLSTQCLYFHLNMSADDDGFVNAPKKIMKIIGASEDDLKLLIVKNFVIVFDSGIIVIKHWRMHNTIRQDRYHPTDYVEEFKQLSLKENNSYHLQRLEKIEEHQERLATKWQPNGNQMETEIRLDKNRLDKNSIESKKKFVPPTLEEVKSYIQEKQLNVDGDKFFNYYEVGDWKDSKGNKVKNWKQKILTWDKKEPKKKVEAVPVYDTSNNVKF